MSKSLDMTNLQIAHLTREASGSVVVIPLTRDLLIWIDRTPRTYAETMEAWRSSCPRLTIWEDALAEGLVHVQSGGTRMSDAPVVLTPRGRDVLG